MPPSHTHKVSDKDVYIYHLSALPINRGCACDVTIFGRSSWRTSKTFPVERNGCNDNLRYNSSNSHFLLWYSNGHVKEFNSLDGAVYPTVWWTRSIYFNRDTTVRILKKEMTIIVTCYSNSNDMQMQFKQIILQYTPVPNNQPKDPTYLFLYDRSTFSS